MERKPVCRQFVPMHRVARAALSQMRKPRDLFGRAFVDAGEAAAALGLLAEYSGECTQGFAQRIEFTLDVAIAFNLRERAFRRKAIEREAHALDPVSYTHLRAHETVLDLVCR